MKMDYFEAMANAHNGKRVQRKAWQNVNPEIFVFLRPADELPNEMIPNIRSLPETTKKALAETKKPIFFSAYMCLFNGKNHVINNWQPSETDKKVEDWIVLD